MTPRCSASQACSTSRLKVVSTSLAECDVFVLEAQSDHASVAAVSQASSMSSGATSSTAGRIKGRTSTSASFDCDFTMDVQGGVVVALVGCFFLGEEDIREKEETRREEKRREEKRRRSEEK